MKWTLFLLLVVGAVVLAAAQDLEEDNELFADEQDEASTAEDNSSNEDDDDDQVNLRVVRSAQSEGEKVKGRNRGSARGNVDQQQDRRRRGEGKACRYTKGAWSECDTATNQRTRSLTLKKGDSSCESSKTITKKCKKGGAGGAGRRNRN